MAGEDKDYCRWLRTQRCCACGFFNDRMRRAPAWHETQSFIVVHHHTTRRSFGTRAHDHDGMPMCWQCHDDFHAGRGQFSGWTRDERREWQHARVAEQQAAFEEEHGRKPDEAPDGTEDIF